jgi:hypothetical protein
MRGSLVVLAVASVTMAACTTSDMREEPMEQALTQPLKDLSLLREEAPEPLKRAAAAPYRSPADCTAIRNEIAQLNALLGKDFDEEVKSDEKVGEVIASNLIGSAVDLPLSGVIRHLTGASKRAREKADAIVASVARRGYLRGLAAERCS